MLDRVTQIIFISLALSACNSVEQHPTASAVAPAAELAQPKREKILCSNHYADVREAILGMLRGTESLPLIQVATRVSSTVLDDTESRFNADCSFDSQKFRALRVPTTTSVTPLQGKCAALVERIDKRCLQPLVERGKSLDKNCHVALIGIADHDHKEVARKMRDDDFCESVQESL